MAINDELLDQLMKGYEKPGDLLGKDGLFMEPKKALKVSAASTVSMTRSFPCMPKA